MSEFQLTTPVAFIIFNRPDTTERVFAEIARARPPKLLVVGDGPRANRPGEAKKVAACRAIIDRVDWPCEVLTNYSEANLGCKVRVSSGLDWVFEQVPEAIILEDDCLPHPTFFRFCQELLERYRDDERIGMISGDNYLFDRTEINSSYYFTKYSNIWGWASWRRAWTKYDVTLRHWPEFLQSRGFENFNMSRSEVAFWTDVFSKTFQDEIDTWDYQWVFTNFINNRVSINPAVNLISNIGFGVGATHTTGDSIYANMKTLPVDFPMMHPNFLSVNYDADRVVANGSYIKHSIIERSYRKIIRELKKIFKS
jgi:hypothetical protein